MLTNRLETPKTKTRGAKKPAKSGEKLQKANGRKSWQQSVINEGNQNTKTKGEKRLHDHRGICSCNCNCKDADAEPDTDTLTRPN